MKSRVKTVIIGSLVAGSLIVHAAPAIARDYWHWVEREHRWDRRADLRSEQRDLDEARQQLRHDRDHHASRRKIAEDEARIRDLERDISEDRRAIR